MINNSSAEKATKSRYAAGAQAREEQLCCPVDYDTKYLEIIPAEVIERDYGCGDPSAHVLPGETVLDLGSGTGKICFIAAQVVGAQGRVIGVDMTDEMLEVARRNAPIVAERIGYANVEFRKGRIQDLSLDLEALQPDLAEQPVTDAETFVELENRVEKLRSTQPMIANDSIDVVVSNCVLNLVDNHKKEQLFAEIFRVLRRGGRAVISDIVSDETVPIEMQKDPELWSGCISGAMREDDFLQAFSDAGFHGIKVLQYQKDPWRTAEGIQFRSVTICAYKGKEGACLERNQAVIYHGPFSRVSDDDGHVFFRGKRSAVCDKTYQLVRAGHYGEDFTCIDPVKEIPLAEAKAFDCSRTARRHPRETKGKDYKMATQAAESCSDGGCC